MANTIALAQKFLPILDEVYKVKSLTARMDAQRGPDFVGTNVVNVMKLTTVGLGNYSRNLGYPIGDVNLAMEAWTLSQDRGRELSVDRMDNEETLGVAYGRLTGEFLSRYVIPETDAYRFAKYASAAGIGTATATLDKNSVIAALDVALGALDDAGVPEEGRLLYMSYPVLRMHETAVSRQLANENGVDRRVRTWDGIPVIGVPQSRFYTQITLDPGATASAGGYAKTATTGADINFMLLDPTAVIQANKFDNMKIFSPDVNQKKDAWLIQYRQYYDAFVYANRVGGIYVHKKAAG